MVIFLIAYKRLSPNFFLSLTSLAWEEQNGHFQINLTPNLTDFDGNGNKGSVNYSDDSEGKSKLLMVVREEVKFAMALRELALYSL